MSNWRDVGGSSDNKDRLKVAAAAAGIIAAIILVIVTVVNIAQDRNKTTATPTTTSTTNTIPDAILGSPPVAPIPTGPTASSIREPDPKGFDFGSPEGNVYDSASQLQSTYSRKKSNLDDAKWAQVGKITSDFIVADATGKGVDQFGYYYTDGYQNLPWIKDFELLWVYGNEDQTGVIHGTAWFNGTSLVDGKRVQVTQDVYLDKTNYKIIQDKSFSLYGISYNPVTCCTRIQPIN